MKLQQYRKLNKSKNLFNLLKLYSTYILLQPLYIKTVNEIRNILKKEFSDIKISLINTKIIKKSKKTEKIQKFLTNITNHILIIFITNEEKTKIKNISEIIKIIENIKNIQINTIVYKEQLLDKQDIENLKHLMLNENNPYKKIEKTLTTTTKNLILYKKVAITIYDKIKNNVK